MDSKCQVPCLRVSMRGFLVVRGIQSTLFEHLCARYMVGNLRIRFLERFLEYPVQYSVEKRRPKVGGDRVYPYSSLKNSIEEKISTLVNCLSVEYKKRSL
jgi:hypothetical protein